MTTVSPIVSPGATPQLLNRTARRIKIHRMGHSPLLLAPFGHVPLDEAALDPAELARWTERGYLKLCAEEPGACGRLQASDMALTVGLVATVALWLTSGGWQLAVVAGILGCICVGPQLRVWLRKRRDTGSRLIRDELWRALGIILVGHIGFGIPLAAVFLQTGESLAAIAAHAPRAIASLLMFALFVGCAATLPAMLFFLFAEQRHTVMKEQFHRDVLRLEPGLRTLEEVEQVYSPLLDDALGGRKGPLFFAPVVISTFLLALGWVVATLPKVHAVAALIGAEPPEFYALFTPNPTAFSFAFFGTYFFSINMVFRRYVRTDLGPKAYSHVAVRIIIASILAWVVSQAFPAAPSSDSELTDVGWVLLVAFLIGVLPETSFAILQDVLKNKFIGQLISTLDERQPLGALEGITLYDRARLLEEGIENIENLAHHNLVDLLLRTRIPAPRLVDLVDQSILYLHAQDCDDRQPSLLRVLKAWGVRTATDMERVAPRLLDASATATLSAELRERVYVLREALADDEWMAHVRSWHDYRKSYEHIYDFEEFETAESLRPSCPTWPPRPSESFLHTGVPLISAVTRTSCETDPVCDPATT